MARVVSMTGDMDAAAMKTQRPLFEELADTGEDITLDMADVEFIDSSGVGAIVFLYKRVLAVNRKLNLVNLRGQPLQLLTYLRVTELVTK